MFKKYYDVSGTASVSVLRWKSGKVLGQVPLEGL